MKVEFKCPECGSKYLEEVMTNITQSSWLTDLEVEDGIANCDYVISDMWDGDIARYQCWKCGHVLKIKNDEVNTLEGLALWFEENK